MAGVAEYLLLQSNIRYSDVGELFNVYDCFKMQISNKGCGVIISLLNGRFLVQLCIRVCSWHVSYQRNEARPRQLCQSAVPTLLTCPGSSWSAKDLFCVWKWELLFGYVILKKSSFAWNILYAFNTEVRAWGKLVWMSHRHRTKMARGCPVTLLQLVICQT